MQSHLEINKTFFHSILIILLGLAIYGNVLNGEFQFDDKPYIVENPQIHQLSDWKSILTFKIFRPVGMYSFALNYYFSGNNPFSYHLTNVIIHMINSLIIYAMILLLYKTPALKNHSSKVNYRWLALAASLLFLTHPLQTQAVSYITQRLASLAALFYYLSAACYIKGRLNQYNRKPNRRFFVLSLISALFGMFTKETLFTLPLMILMIEFYFFKPLMNTEEKRKKAPWLLLSTLVLSMLIIPAFFKYNFSRVFAYRESYSHRGEWFHPGEYLLTQVHVVADYIKLFFFPINLRLDYDYHISRSLFELPTLLSFIFLMSIAVLAVMCFKKHRLISFGIVWYFLTASVESSIIPIRHVIFEHRTYLSSFGMCLAVTYALFSFIKNRSALTMLLICGLTCLSLLTVKRNIAWKSEISLWEDNLKHEPMKGRVYGNLSAAYIEKGRMKDAGNLLTKAIQRHIVSDAIYANLGEVYFHQKDYDKAKFYFLMSKSFPGMNITRDISLGLTYFQLNEFQQARDILQPIIEQGFSGLRESYTLAKTLHHLGETDSAINLLEQIIKKYPRDKYCIYTLSTYYWKNNEKEHATLAANYLFNLLPNKEQKMFFAKKYEEENLLEMAKIFTTNVN